MEFFLFTLLIFLGRLATNAQKNDSPYNFPVKPGTGQWKKITTGKEMLSACDIPDSVLNSLTTMALAKTCLQYPLLNHIFFSNNLQKGTENIIKNSNALTELFKRKDAGEKLLTIYQSMNAEGMDKGLDLVGQGMFTFDFTYIELLLSQPQVLNSLATTHKTILAKEAVKKYEGKTVLKDVFGEFGCSASAFMIARILEAEGKLGLIKTTTSKELDIFLSTVTFEDSSTLINIYNAGKTL